LAPGVRTPLPVPEGAPLSCTLALEHQARRAGFRAIAGVDEVGRGALCGPVYAAAVILDGDCDTTGINDSKQLTARQRERLGARIRSTSRAWAIGAVEAEDVDALGIVAATHLAMRRAIDGLAVAADLLLIDGFAISGVALPQWPVIKGDARSVSIAAASIVAKVSRDALMRELDLLYPGYGIGHNMGYGSQEHCEALGRLGPSAIHRRSFCRTQLRLFSGHVRAARDERAP
jgi:ribonuclease HII